MPARDLALLEEIGLSLYDRQALAALMVLGVADAAAVCREGAVPSSKVYRAMEKLCQLGLVQIQPTRPRIYAALAPDVVTGRVVELARERAERFAEGSVELGRTLASLTGRVRGRQTFVDLALGAESHVKRHLIHLAAARQQIVSYMERSDLAAVDHVVDSGFPILRRIARNAAAHRVRHRVIFGFSYASAPRLVEFLQKHRNDVRHLTGVRYSGELGHPFHIVDDRTVVLPLDHPFVPAGPFASLLVRDPELAAELGRGFEGLWSKAMRSLRKIDFDPRR